MAVYFYVLVLIITTRSGFKVLGSIMIINVLFGLVTYSMSIARAAEYDCWAHPDTINNSIKSSCTFTDGVTDCNYDSV